jgi:hypothetical protein
MGKAARRKRDRNVMAFDFTPDADKISTRLNELIEPHLDLEEETVDSYKALVVLGIMAWNFSLFPPEERITFVRNAVRSAVANGFPLTERWLNDLIARKLRLFPSDERFIENFEAFEGPDGDFKLVVAASVPA